jgi:hypothetical protein
MCCVEKLDETGKTIGSEDLQFEARTKVCKVVDSAGRPVAGCNLDIAPGAKDVVKTHDGHIMHKGCAKRYRASMEGQKKQTAQGNGNGAHSSSKLPPTPPAFSLSPPAKPENVMDMTERFRKLDPAAKATS